MTTFSSGHEDVIDEDCALRELENQVVTVQIPPVFLGIGSQPKTMVSVTIHEPHTLARRVLCRTVAKVDSMGLVVRR